MDNLWMLNVLHEALEITEEILEQLAELRVMLEDAERLVEVEAEVKEETNVVS